MKKVLVTGNLGYVGGRLVPFFQEAGYHVTGIDVGYYEEFFLGVNPKPDRQLYKDMRHIELSDLEGFDAIVHMAALSNDPMGELNKDLTYQINREASYKLASLAKKAGVPRFVFFSSCSIYGASNQDDYLNEEAPLNPVSSYAFSKIEAEEKIKSLADSSFSPTFLRFSTAYGASPRLRLDIVLNNLFASAFFRNDIKVLSDGTPWRPMVHIEDMAQSAWAVLQEPSEKISGESFNIGRNDSNYRVREIAEAVKHSLPQSEVNILGENTNDPRSYKVSFDKASSILTKFAPSWTIEKGCEELKEFFSTYKDQISGKIDSYEFIRLKQLKRLRELNKLDENLYFSKSKQVA